jgi:glycosyltransferase involved in cell wall biosynthesis
MSNVETPRRFVAAVGDSTDPVTWSGIPFHLLQALKETDPSWSGLPLAADGPVWASRRLAWNAQQVMTGDQRGGYQYSTRFLEKLWSPHREEIQDGQVINCFQLYPPSVVEDDSVEKWFFIDQTLEQLFDHYGERQRVGRRIAASALDREAEGYRSATGVIAHSSWAADGVRSSGVDPGKVYVVVPGASICQQVYRDWEQNDAEQDRVRSGDLRLVFVGKDPYRKGLDRLLRAVHLARKDGARIKLRVIGCDRTRLQPELRDFAWVEWLGFMSKTTQASEFLRAVASCDVGCLLSRAEAGGISVREFHALGLPVLATASGGTPDHVSPSASWLVVPNAQVSDIARRLVELHDSPDLLEAARGTIWGNRHDFLYSAAVSRIDRLMSQGSATS